MKGILTRIRKLCFNNVWKGKSENLISHLVSWKLFSRSKDSGGLGLKYLVSFDKSLVAKSLWVFLRQYKLWWSILYDRYIFPKTIIDWIQGPCKDIQITSN